MKMVLAILNSDDASTVMHNLMKEGYQITKLSTTGGFLRAGNVTVPVSYTHLDVYKRQTICSN